MTEEAKKILLVDDDPDVRLLVGARIKSAGYHVIKAVDGDEAVQLALDESPALLVLDLGLPKKDGLEVCRILKSTPATRHTPIIILSAKSQEADHELVRHAGADTYMTKPFDPQELLAKIQALLDKPS